MRRELIWVAKLLLRFCYPLFCSNTIEKQSKPVLGDRSTVLSSRLGGRLFKPLKNNRSSWWATKVLV